MTSKAMDDFIDDCFVSGDEICRTTKYEDRVNNLASILIEEMLKQKEAA